MPKRGSLESLKSKKATEQAAATESPGQPANTQDSEPAPPKIKTTSVRLTEDAWRQLAHLATDLDCHAHDLIIDGVNRVFEENGKPPIAQRRPAVSKARRNQREGGPA